MFYRKLRKGIEKYGKKDVEIKFIFLLK